MAETTSTVNAQLDQTRERIAGDTQGIRSKIVGRTQNALHGVSGSISHSVKQPKQSMGRLVSNPIGMAIGAMAVGWLAGTLAPSSRLEKEKLGEASGQVKQSAEQLGREAIEKGRELASETIGEMRTALSPSTGDSSEGSTSGQQGQQTQQSGAAKTPGTDPGSLGGINPTTAPTSGPASIEQL